MSITEKNLAQQYIEGILQGNGASMSLMFKNPNWMEGVYPNVLFWLSYCPNADLKDQALETLESKFSDFKDYLSGTLLVHVQAARGSMPVPSKEELAEASDQLLLATDFYGVTPPYYASLYGRMPWQHIAEVDDEVANTLDSPLRRLVIPDGPLGLSYFRKLISEERRDTNLQSDEEPFHYYYSLMYMHLAVISDYGNYARKQLETLVTAPWATKHVHFKPCILAWYNLNVYEQGLLSSGDLGEKIHEQTFAQLNKLFISTMKLRPTLENVLEMIEGALALYREVRRQHIIPYALIDVIRPLLDHYRAHASTEEVKMTDGLDFELLSLQIARLRQDIPDEAAQYLPLLELQYTAALRLGDPQKQFDTLFLQLPLVNEREKVNQLVGLSLRAFAEMKVYPRDVGLINERLRITIRHYFNANAYDWPAQCLKNFVAACYDRKQAFNFEDEVLHLLQVRNSNRDNLNFVYAVDAVMKWIGDSCSQNSAFNPSILAALRNKKSLNAFMQCQQSVEITNYPPLFYSASDLNILLENFHSCLLQNGSLQNFHFRYESFLALVRDQRTTPKFREDAATLLEGMVYPNELSIKLGTASGQFVHEHKDRVLQDLAELKSQPYSRLTTVEKVGPPPAPVMSPLRPRTPPSMNRDGSDASDWSAGMSPVWTSPRTPRQVENRGVIRNLGGLFDEEPAQEGFRTPNRRVRDPEQEPRTPLSEVQSPRTPMKRIRHIEQGRARDPENDVDHRIFTP